MKCKHCEYRLWNLQRRTCPECGEPFKPSDYEFAPNNVAYCCPQCDLPYYGTDVNGHLVPRAFDCVRCGAAVEMDTMVLRPAEDLREELTLPDRNPWLARGEVGQIKGWFKTVGMAMVQPGRLIRATPGVSATGAGFGFALLTAGLTALFGVGFIFLGLMVPILLIASASGSSSGGSPAWAMVGPGAMMVGFMFGGTVVFLLLWGLTAHGILCATGARSAGIGRTYQAMCFSHGATAMGAIPCVGAYIAMPAWIWWIVSATLMLKDGQQVSGGRASAAVLTLPVLGILAYIGLIVAMFVSIGNMTGPAPGGTTNSIGGFTSQLAQPLSNAVLTSNPANIQHPAQMIANGQLTGSDVIAWNSGTFQNQVAVAGATLDSFDTLATSQQRRIARQAVNNLPANNAPYRFGDVIFTHRGIDPNNHPADLWIAVVHHDPQTAWAGGTTSSDIGIVRLNGTTRTFSPSRFQQARQKENARRQQHNLPAIPDPKTLTQVGGLFGQPGASSHSPSQQTSPSTPRTAPSTSPPPPALP